ncbi:hypothetical protein Q1695_010042 [Nippostrongylus brasiliensis]|nr:hypothetical protein Q1695_010042 [Nippostrongylus brasiliensis]
MEADDGDVLGPSGRSPMTQSPVDVVEAKIDGKDKSAGGAGAGGPVPQTAVGVAYQDSSSSSSKKKKKKKGEGTKALNKDEGKEKDEKEGEKKKPGDAGLSDVFNHELAKTQPVEEDHQYV